MAWNAVFGSLRHEREEISNAYQVVDAAVKVNIQPTRAALDVGSCASTYGLDPTEDLFHPFALPLANGVTACRVCGHQSRWSGWRCFGHMRGDVEIAQVNKIARV